MRRDEGARWQLRRLLRGAFQSMPRLHLSLLVPEQLRRCVLTGAEVSLIQLNAARRSRQRSTRDHSQIKRRTSSLLFFPQHAGFNLFRASSTATATATEE